MWSALWLFIIVSLIKLCILSGSVNAFDYFKERLNNRVLRVSAYDVSLVILLIIQI